MSAASSAAVEHNLTICHLDLAEQEDRLAAATTAAQQLYNFTSVNGMFVVLLAGTKTQNAVAGVVIRRPEG